MKPPDYEREGDWLVHRYRMATDDVLTLQAKDCRRSGTGLHALVALTLNGQPLAYDVFNVERDQERGKLCRSAHRLLGDVHKAAWPEDTLKAALDGFCYGLRRESVADFKGGLSRGDPDIGPPRILLGHCIVEGGGTIVFAPPGRGKSYTGLAMAISLDAGNSTIWQCEQRRVLYVNLERSESSMRWRLSRVGACLGVGPRYEMPMLHRRGGNLADLDEGIRATTEEFRCDVAFLDSLSRSGFGDLKEDRIANSIMDTLNRMIPTWVALAHTPRGDESHTFGSTMFDAAADVTVQGITQLANDSMTVGVGLKVTMANDIPTGGLSIHAFDFDSTGLVAIRKAGGTEFPQIVANKRMSLADEVEEFLLHVPGGKEAAPDIAENIGRRRDEVSRELNKNSRFVAVGKDGRKVLYAVRQS